MSWLALESGQSVADLLTAPASVYYALRRDVITRITVARQRHHDQAMREEAGTLLADLKQKLGRT